MSTQSSNDDQSFAPANSLTDGTFVLLPNVIHVENIPSVVCTEITLKSGAWFGAFGVIESLCVEPKRNTADICYKDAVAAQMAIQRMGNSAHGMRVRYGLSSFCPYWLQQQECPDSQCDRIHHRVRRDLLLVQEIRQVQQSSSASTIESSSASTCSSMESPLPSRSPSHSQSLSMTTQQQQGQSQSLEAEHFRLRRKHCDLIRDYNILQQQHQKDMRYKAQCDQLRMKMKKMSQQNIQLQRQHNANKTAFKQLNEHCQQLQYELISCKRSENEIRDLMFSDISTPPPIAAAAAASSINDANAKHDPDEGFSLASVPDEWYAPLDELEGSR